MYVNNTYEQFFNLEQTVLVGTSKFFQNIFSQDESSGIFQINGIDANDMMKILDFIYTGQMNITKRNVDAIDALARQLQIDLLNQVRNEFLMYTCFAFQNYPHIYYST